MDMHGDSSSGNACKISMLWNWYTIDACFLSKSWQIKNDGMFAASCIGIALLVVSLELLRRLGKEYDMLIVRQFKRHQRAIAAAATYADSTSSLQPKSATCCPAGPKPTTATSPRRKVVFRASPLQQLVRAVIHAAVFGVAYIIMLLAMYYNGFVIISIIIGAGLGKFVCDWMVIGMDVESREEEEAASRGAVDEATVCCG